ncbi:MAG TPA: FAD-dependent oxidoreductase [Actinomycetota bacterium]|jgi:D-amino-acid oxidase
MFGSTFAEPNDHSVLVIGAGVTGLTTAWCLRREGFAVTVVAEKFAPNIVSVVAGALWEWPPAVCGAHHDEVSLTRSKEWCMTSYEVFDELSRRPGTGVFLRPVIFYFKSSVCERPRDLAKMNELKDKVKDFIHDAGLIEENHVNPAAGVKDAYGHSAPMIDTDTYLGWLMSQVIRAGCTVVQGRIAGSLRDRERHLRRLFGADCIINCTGLGAMDLTEDDMYPLRGALIRVRNDGRAMPRITKAHCMAHDPASREQDMIFIVPRGRNMLLLGGMTEPDEWSLDIGFDNYSPISEMLQRCREFLPSLAHAQVDEDEPVRVGLRPFRHRNVRLEWEPGSRIIHNYGHGGSGVTLSWGCAQEVVELAKQLVSEDETEIQRASA